MGWADFDRALEIGIQMVLSVPRSSLVVIFCLTVSFSYAKSLSVAGRTNAHPFNLTVLSGPGDTSVSLPDISYIDPAGLSASHATASASASFGLLHVAADALVSDGVTGAQSTYFAGADATWVTPFTPLTSGGGRAGNMAWPLGSYGFASIFKSILARSNEFVPPHRARPDGFCRNRSKRNLR